MATPRETALNPLELLQSLVGSSQNIDKSVTSQETGTQNATTTGTQSQATSGSQAQATTGTTTGTSNQTTTGSADIAGLQQILAQQQKGITPEMLNAIFQKGSEQVPGIVTAYGNAVGARATNNDPIAQMTLALADKTNNQAAMMQQQLMSDASATAARIAEATKSQTTTGTNSNQTAQNSSTANTQNTNTSSNQNQATTTDATKTGSEKTQNDIAINNDQLLKILAVALGGSALNSALPNGLEGLWNGVSGGLSQAGGGLVGALPKALQQLLGGMGSPVNATADENLAMQDLFGMPSGEFQIGDWLQNLNGGNDQLTSPVYGEMSPDFWESPDWGWSFEP